MNIADGTYAARPGAASVYESKQGALVLALAVKIQDGPELKSYHTLVNKDGAINTRTIDNLKAWSGWDGVDPFWFMENDLSGIDVEVVIANEPGFNDPTKMFAKVKWINPPGGGGGKGADMPEASDKRSILAKYGAKFRAVSGGVPAARAAAPKPATTATAEQPTLPRRDLQQPAARPAAPVARPKPSGSTQAAAWGKMCELGAKLTQAQKEDIWFKCVDATGMDQADMTPEGWAKVLSSVEQHFAGLAPAGSASDDDDCPI